MSTYNIFDLKTKPYNLLFLAGILLVILSFLPITQETALDINMHDTYLVIAHVYIYWSFAVILLGLWFIYHMINRLTLSRKLTWFHIISTLLPLVIFLNTMSHSWGMSGVPRRYYAMSEFGNDKSLFNIGTFYVITLLMLVVGQVVFLINLGGVIIKTLRKQKTQPN